MMKKSKDHKSNLKVQQYLNLKETLFPNKDQTREMSSLCIQIVLGDFQGKSQFSLINLVIEKRVFLVDQLNSIKVMLAPNRSQVLSFHLWFARFPKVKTSPKCQHLFSIRLKH